MTRRLWSSIAFGGAVAATMDITYAIIFYGTRNGVTPIRVLQSVASGWLGSAAFDGGVPTAALGLVSHYFIALTAAAIYLVSSRRLALRRGGRFRWEWRTVWRSTW